MEACVFSLTSRPGPGEEHEFSRLPVKIGRAWGNDLIINDPSLEPESAEIRREGEEFFLVSTGKVKNIRLNGMPVMDKSRLRDGDEIALGSSAFRFQRGPESGEEPEPEAPADLMGKLKQVPPKQLAMGGMILLVIIFNVVMFSSKKKSKTEEDPGTAGRLPRVSEQADAIPLEDRYPEILKLTLDEKLEQAQSSFELGKKLLEDYNIRNDNLAKAIEEFQRCQLALKEVEPKPDYYGQIPEKLASARDLLQAMFLEHRLELIKSIRLGQWQSALYEIDIIQEIILDHADPRYREAADCRQDIERCINRRGCPETCFEGF